MTTNYRQVLRSAVRVSDQGIDLASVRLVRGNRRVDLVGVMHIAEHAFWDEVEALIQARRAEGFVIQSELIRGGPKPWLMRRVRRFLTGALARRGLTAQMERLDYSEDGPIQVHDCTYADMITAVGRPRTWLVTFGSLVAAGIFAALPVEHRYMVLEPVLGGPKASPMEQGRFGRFHRARERVAIKAVVGTDRDVVTLWGAAHVHRMTSMLIQRGWRVEEVCWRTAVRKPEEECPAEETGAAPTTGPATTEAAPTGAARPAAAVPVAA